MTVRELYTFLYDDRSFILRCNYVPVVFNAPHGTLLPRRTRFGLGHDLIVTYEVKQAKYVINIGRAHRISRRDVINLKRDHRLIYSLTIDYYMLAYRRVGEQI